MAHVVADKLQILDVSEVLRKLSPGALLDWLAFWEMQKEQADRANDPKYKGMVPIDQFFGIPNGSNR